YRDPDNFLRVVFHCKEGINNPHWRNDPYDSVVEEALRTNNQEKRKRLYAQADRMLVAEEAVIIPLSYGEGQMLVKPYVKLPDSRPVTIPLKDFVIRR
nr:hypothetical protein [Gammaproteobacteria bacterium]